MHTPDCKLAAYSPFPHFPSLGSKHGSLEEQASSPSLSMVSLAALDKALPWRQRFIFPQGASDAQTEIELEFI